MYSDYYETLIHKRLSGELTRDEESVHWRSGSRSRPSIGRIVEEAERIWKLTGSAGIDPAVDLNIDLEHEMARFNERLLKEETAPATAQAPVPMARGLRLVWRYAAAAVILIAAVLFWMQVGTDGDAGLVLVETAIDEIREVTLPDNSTVLLNENSRISYAADFSERFVQMSGEVFFDVERDEARPFQIQSGKSRVEVLGTSFVVRYRADEPDIRVTVSTGRVAFSIPETNQREVLDPGYQGRLQKATNRLSVAPNDDPNYQIWRNHSLLFEDTPVSDVVEAMRTHFGIVIEDPSAELGACTFSAEFEAPALDDVIELLSFTVDIDVSVQNDVYEFSGIGCLP